MAAVALWRRDGGRAAARLAGTFGLLAAVVIIGDLLPDRSNHPGVEWARKLIVALVLLFPYLLYRFVASFMPPTRPIRFAAAWLTAAAVAVTLFLPRIPRGGEPRSVLLQAYVGLILVQWVVLSVAVAAILWRAGRAQAALVRLRMRTLGLGALALAAALVAAGLSNKPEDDATPTHLAIQILALVSAPLFLLGFSPPSLVRMVWRQGDESALREAEIRSTGARNAAALAEIVLPAAARLVGGRGAVLADENRQVLGAHGLDPEEANSMASHAPDSASGGTLTLTSEGTTTVTIPLQSGFLLFQSMPFTPFFGREEIERLRRLGVLVDYALERMRADLKIAGLNDELELRVRELEAANRELQAANRELEAFSYSVSHDLRAPLRAIDGFTNILVEEHAQHLSPDARRHLETVRGNAQQMGALIDDLLGLARTARQTLTKQRVEPARIARDALTALEKECDGREVEIRIGDLPPCDADPLLLKQVFLNLIANAIKFTRGKTPGLVEVGWRRQSPPGPGVYFVQDNGVGFDMRYAHKLFGVFQRLHRQEEFEGTGVGLAIVQRIIQRHGGEIWAEGELGRGARFEFVLEP